VNRHLVAVEVGVERRADQRVNLNRLAVHQLRLEGLNAQRCKRWGAVQQNRMLLDDLFERVPNFGRKRSTMRRAVLMLVVKPFCTSASLRTA
jgi:hypothetical protein